MGDNGYFLGDRQLADKWLMYDVSIRIPLIIFDPRIKKPEIIDAMALNIDITKTMLSIAGIKSPKYYQGQNLMSYVEKGNSKSGRKSILIEHLWELPEIPSSEGIRTEKWKYFRYRFINAPEELYDLQNDPLEKNNLATDAKYATILKKLRVECEKKLLEYQSQKLCADDPFIEVVKF
jgi:alpha-L-rhamnosidase